MQWNRLKEILTQWHVEPGYIDDIKKARGILVHYLEPEYKTNELVRLHADRLAQRFNLPIFETQGLKDYTAYEQATAAIKAATINDVLLVTFPDHMWRACEVYKKMGLNPIPAIMFGNRNIYYHQNARRWQLTSRFKFKWFWEIPARFLFLRRGWL